MTDRMPGIWVLLGDRTGDNNQVLALAEALGLPFETRTLRYNALRALSGRVLGSRVVSVRRPPRQWLVPPWPDLVIAIGRRSVPVARWVRRQSGGRTKVVRVGHPRMDPAIFDLVITTRQYPVPPGDNVLLLPLAMSRYRKAPTPTSEELDWLGALPRPHLLMAVGGATKYWQLDPGSVADTAGRLAERSDRAGGSLIVVGSRRTDPEVIQAIEAVVAGRAHCHIAPPALRFAVLLADADETFVTGDSVSMLSEAVLAGKPVGLVPIALNAKGERTLGREDGDTPRRDLRRFWAHLQSEGLVGTLDAPSTRPVEDPAQAAAAAVRKLLGDFVE